MPSLMDIRDQYYSLLTSISENEGEITSELEKSLQENDADLRTKIDAYAFVLEALEVQHIQIKTKADALSALARRFDTQRERLKDWLKLNMRATNKTSFEGHENIIKLSKGRPSVQVQEDLLPIEFWKEKTTAVPDKDLVRTMLEKGESVPGASFQESFRLDIKPNVLTIKGRSKHVPITNGEDYQD